MTTTPTLYDMSEEKISPFHSFLAVYKILIWVGFYKQFNKPKNKFMEICCDLYRPLALIVVVVFTIGRVTFIIQRRDNVNDLFDGTMLVIPLFNLITKVVTLNWNIPKVDKINDLLNDPIFAANTKEDEKMLLENTRKMHLCVKVVKIGVTVSVTVMFVSFFVKRFQDPSVKVPVYIPFETDTWSKYTLSAILEVMPIIWTGYGHMSLDCLIVTYYAQAKVQLQIIKYNLEHLFDTDDVTDADGAFQYKDVLDKDIRTRFVHYVQRYDAVAWYTDEIGKVFNIPISLEFFSSSVTLCLATVRMSITPVMSPAFVFLILFLTVFLTQLFVYCYFGNLVQDESDSVMTSIYLSDWVSTSPQFRRLLLIAMTRWSRGLTPTIAGIVPLSFNTFVAILKSTYSLFALLSTKQ